MNSRQVIHILFLSFLSMSVFAADSAKRDINEYKSGSVAANMRAQLEAAKKSVVPQLGAEQVRRFQQGAADTKRDQAASAFGAIRGVEVHTTIVNQPVVERRVETRERVIERPVLVERPGVIERQAPPAYFEQPTMHQVAPMLQQLVVSGGYSQSRGGRRDHEGFNLGGLIQVGLGTICNGGIIGGDCARVPGGNGGWGMSPGEQAAHAQGRADRLAQIQAEREGAAASRGVSDAENGWPSRAQWFETPGERSAYERAYGRTRDRIERARQRANDRAAYDDGFESVGW